MDVVELLFPLFLFVGGFAVCLPCFIFGVKNTFKALEHRNPEIADHSLACQLNPFNALWVPGALTEEGKKLRKKSLIFLGIILGYGYFAIWLSDFIGMF